ncbi:MAG: hypothetical protein HY675_22355 [Chloroflexi bacterium]|nr:hypothetical protein [Chloroflexota bacterium]
MVGKHLGSTGVAALKSAAGGLQAANWRYLVPSGLKRSLQGRDAYPTSSLAT